MQIVKAYFKHSNIWKKIVFVHHNSLRATAKADDDSHLKFVDVKERKIL